MVRHDGLGKCYVTISHNNCINMVVTQCDFGLDGVGGLIYLGQNHIRDCTFRSSTPTFSSHDLPNQVKE